MTQSLTITVNTRWWSEHTQREVIVTRVTDNRASKKTPPSQ